MLRYEGPWLPDAPMPGIKKSIKTDLILACDDINIAGPVRMALQAAEHTVINTTATPDELTSALQAGPPADAIVEVSLQQRTFPVPITRLISSDQGTFNRPALVWLTFADFCGVEKQSVLQEGYDSVVTNSDLDPDGFLEKMPQAIANCVVDLRQSRREARAKELFH